jgi:hypothetical protein
MILFLDYDGVLHPDAAYLVNGRPQLCAQGSLFMWAPLLEETLAPHPQVRIVLATSWVRVLKSFSRTRAYLPPALQARVIGATWHSAMARHHEGAHRVDAGWFQALSRYAQIARYLSRAGHHAEHWLAIDDDSEGWPAEMRSHLVETDRALGLASASARSELAQRLQAVAAEARGGNGARCYA